MKKLFVSVCLLATSIMASAQFATGDAGNSFRTSTKTFGEVSEHNSFFVQYNLLGVGDFADLLDDWDAESEKLNGISLGYNHAFALTQSIPLFVEVGAGLTYAWATFIEEDYTDDCWGYPGCDDECSYSYKEVSQHLMVNIPVNLMYKFQIPNSSIVLEPYVGLNVKAHLLGRMKGTETFEACCKDTEELYEEYMEEVDEDDMVMNYFDKKDMGGKKYVASRLNIGWQIGANVDFGSAFVGISYGSDFGKYMEWEDDEDWTFSTTNITVGFRF